MTIPQDGLNGHSSTNGTYKYSAAPNSHASNSNILTRIQRG